MISDRRQGVRLRRMSVVVATAVNGEGRREVGGIDVGTSEDGAFWLQFLRSLVSRGLSGVQLVTSDATGGLRRPSPRCSPGRPGNAAGPTS